MQQTIQMSTPAHNIKSLNQRIGAPGLNPRVSVGSLIVKHKLQLSDEETISTIQQNIFIKYFLGLDKYHPEPLFHQTVVGVMILGK